jgi:catechol 2,3-dioxygenase-like lactoylglutathione lyase family enzyme
MKIEVLTLPVADVDRALRFYTSQVGFVLDVDYRPSSTYQVVQLTPPGEDWHGEYRTRRRPRPSEPRDLHRFHRPGRQHVGHPGSHPATVRIAAHNR